jgi:pentatricopeptide repeat protein
MVALNPTEDYVFNLAHYYYKQQNWSAFVDTYLLSGMDGSSSSYTQSIYATALMKLGRYQEARQLFQQAMDSDLSHRFVGNYIATALYEDEELDSALDIAQRYPERMSGGTATNWTELMVQLMKESEKSALPESYMQQLRQ